MTSPHMRIPTSPPVEEMVAAKEVKYTRKKKASSAKRPHMKLRSSSNIPKA